jgi:hypothetical protein
MPELPATQMTDQQISAELASMDLQWEELQRHLDECGGMAGSPGEHLYERTNELETEQNRRAARNV